MSLYRGLSVDNKFIIGVGRYFDQSRRAKSLGAEGVLPGGHIESLLRVFKQFTHTFPSG